MKSNTVAWTLSMALAVALALGSTGRSDSVYGTPAAFDGTRTVVDSPPGLETDDADWQDVELEWSVDAIGGGIFSYEYTLSGFDRPEISHFTLDISDDAISGDMLADPLAITDAALNGLMIPLELVEFGDKDGITGAVKFDVGGDFADNAEVLTYTFNSNRQPVYHDLFIKGGQSDLKNTGFDNHGSMEVTDFIAAPNSVPEPASSLLLLISAAVLAPLRRRCRIG